MTRPIDADALKELFPDNGEGSWTYNVTVKACIDAQPTIDALPVKHGKWITEEKDCIYGKKIRLKCSECGDTFDVSEMAYPYERFCRYCGARMDKDE